MNVYFFRSVLFPVLAGLGVALVASSLPAQTSWIDAAGNDLWSDSANWSSGVPGSSSDVVFDDTGASTVAGAVTSVVDLGTTIGTLRFANTGAAGSHSVQIAAGQTLSISGGGSGTVLVVGNLTSPQANTTAFFTGSTGTLSVNNPTADIAVGQLDHSSTSANSATLDLSALGAFNATINEFRLLAMSASTDYRASRSATVVLADTNTITADRIALGGTSYLGGSATMSLGLENTLHVDTIVVGDSRVTGTLDFRTGLVGTPSVTIRGKAGGDSRANLIVADQRGEFGLGGGGGSSNISGTVNFAGANVDARLNNLIVGIGANVGSNIDGRGEGAVTFDQGTIDATSIVLGRVVNVTSAGTASKYSAGTLTMSGTANLVAGNMVLGQNLDLETGVNLASSGTFNVAGGTASISGNILMGDHTGTSTRGGSATINQTGGVLSVTGGIVEGAAVGANPASAFYLDSGTASVGNGLSVDRLRVGYNGATGSLTVAAGAVRIGSGTSDAFEVGRKSLGGQTAGTAHFGGTSGVVIDVGNMYLGVQTSGTPSPTGTTIGNVTLSQTGHNSIHATNLTLGNSPSPGNEGTWNRLFLGGGTNEIYANTTIIGGAKSLGEISVPVGASLTLAARDGVSGMTLRMAVNASNTSSTSYGTLDLRGATVDALFDSMVLGQHNAGSGGARALFAMDTGVVRANSILMANPSASGTSTTPDKTEGNFILDGGELVAGAITRGTTSVAARAVFDFNAGTFAFGTFGSESLPMDLENTGTGALNPGVDLSGVVVAQAPVGTATLFGDYTQGENASLHIDIDPFNNDLLVVHGNASLQGDLNVLLLDGYLPQMGSYFDVVQTTGSLNISGLAVSGDMPSPSFGWWETAVLGSGEGYVLRLTAVPEPSSAALLVAIWALIGGGVLRRKRA